MTSSNLSIHAGTESDTTKHLVSLDANQAITAHDKWKVVSSLVAHSQHSHRSLLSSCELANVISGKTGIPVHLAHSIVREHTQAT